MNFILLIISAGIPINSEQKAQNNRTQKLQRHKGFRGRNSDEGKEKVIKKRSLNGYIVSWECEERLDYKTETEVDRQKYVLCRKICLLVKIKQRDF